MNRVLRTVGFAHALAGLALFFLPTRADAQTPVIEHRWAGTIYDSFTLDGQVIFTAEDAGRIRHRTASGAWSYQDVPDAVRQPIRRVHFLDSQTGWAVSTGDGWLIKTTNGGTTWSTRFTSDQLPGLFNGELMELWDVHFLDQNNGWLLGLHAMWYTSNGGNAASDWQAVALYKQDGVTLYTRSELEEIEFYALDVVAGVSPPILGMACAEPGLVFRMEHTPSLAPARWRVVFDVLSLCGTPALKGCEKAICPPAPPGSEPAKYEPWDIEIGRNPALKLAIMVGGWGFSCGMICTSSDDGDTWTKENHECYCPSTLPPPVIEPCYLCSADPRFQNDPTVPNDVYYQTHLNTIYGGAIVDETGVAVGGGYAGQVVVRDPVFKVWRDRSQYSSDWVTTPAAVTMPMQGVSAPPGVSMNTTVLMTGLGGYMRRSSDSGQTWTTEPTTNGTVGEPWRSWAVHFLGSNTNHGWLGSQFFRLAESTTGGARWEERDPRPEFGTEKLRSIAFANDFRGVAVGEPDDRATYTDQYKPKILYTTDGGSTTWKNATFASSFADGDTLREVVWVGGDHYWAAGTNGLILQALDNAGSSWSRVVPPGETTTSIQSFDIHGLGYTSASKLIFAGVRPAATGAAYQWRNQGGTITWTQITIADPSAPSNSVISFLADVDISANKAYAVGRRTESGGVERGVLLESTANASGNFQTLTVIKVVDQCPAEDDESLASLPAMNKVKLVPGSGEVFIGGSCGRIWWYQPSTSTLTEIKSR